MIKNIRHTAIIVSNLELALKFYRDILGLEVIIQKDLEGKDITELLNFGIYNVKMTYVKLATKEYSSLVEIIYFHSPEMRLYIDFKHIAFTVDNLYKLIKKLKENNIKILSESRIMNNHKLVFIRDYDFNLIELVEELHGNR